MSNTYPSLSVKGMIYIHSGSQQISVSSQKTAQGRPSRSEDPVYTVCGPKICMGTMVYDVFKSQMHNFDGTRQVHYKPNTVPDSKPGSIPMMSVSQLRGGSRGVVPRMRSNFILSSMGHIYIYICTSIHIYSVRITMKVARWMKPIRWYRDGKSEHYWLLDIIYIPPDSSTCTI